MVCEVAIEEIKSGNEDRRSHNDWIDDVTDAVVQIVITVVTISGGTLAPEGVIVGAIAWATERICTAIWDYLVTYTYDQFEDDDAKDAVICHMYLALRGETPQFEDWSESLDNFEPENANETAISTVVKEWLGDLDIFINYMLMMEDVLQVVEYLPECDCPEPTLIKQLAGSSFVAPDYWGRDFTSPTSLSFGAPTDDWGVAPGSYEPANNYYYGVLNSTGGVACNIRVTLPPNMLVTDVVVCMGASKPDAGTFNGDNRCAFYLGEPGAGGTYIGGHVWTAGFYTDQLITVPIHDIDTTVTEPQDYLYLHASVVTTQGTVYIYYIEITLIPYTP